VPSIALLHDCCTLATQEDALRTWKSASTQQSQHDLRYKFSTRSPENRRQPDVF